MINPLEAAMPSGGRHAEFGAGLLVERIGPKFGVRCIGPALFVCAEGEALAGTDHERAALKAAFASGEMEFVRSLRWREPPVADRSWFIGTGWSLGYDAPEDGP